MDAELERFVREQKDRAEIHNLVLTYCKGIDRLDRDLLRSVYHADALDDHGVFVGPADQYIEWVLAHHGKNQQRTMHSITTHFCHLDGDAADVESYYIYRALNRKAPFFSTVHGRYLDRFEKHNGRWGIAHRLCLVDITDETFDPNGDLGDRIHPKTSRDRDDASFKRPYKVDRSRFTV